ncbi:MAG: hypothetical protein ACI9SP_004078 [Arenicella sp.]|jgi:hypothetical protein
MINHRRFAFIAVLIFSSTSNAQEPRDVFDVEIKANIDDIWNVFTTTEGRR